MRFPAGKQRTRGLHLGCTQYTIGWSTERVSREPAILLLQALSPDDLDQFLSHCQRGEVIRGETLLAVGQPLEFAADMPSTTALSLNVFLQSHHQRMPSLQLDRGERDAVVDYILSLKADQAGGVGNEVPND